MINPLKAISGLPAGGKLNPFTSFGALAQHGHLINLWDVNVLGTMKIIVRKGVSRTDGKFSVFLIRTSAMFDYYTLLGKKAQDIIKDMS
jgi:hypothetical protein